MVVPRGSRSPGCRWTAPMGLGGRSDVWTDGTDRRSHLWSVWRNRRPMDDGGPRWYERWPHTMVVRSRRWPEIRPARRHRWERVPDDGRPRSSDVDRDRELGAWMTVADQTFATSGEWSAIVVPTASIAPDLMAVADVLEVWPLIHDPVVVPDGPDRPVHQDVVQTPFDQAELTYHHLFIRREGEDRRPLSDDAIVHVPLELHGHLSSVAEHGDLMITGGGDHSAPGDRFIG